MLVQQVPLPTEPLFLAPMNLIFHDFILEKSLIILAYKSRYSQCLSGCGGTYFNLSTYKAESMWISVSSRPASIT